ncbi:MAG: hypothetical protein QOK43_1941 [Acidimicrobiaceae bacterium]|jgi:hypothetical protein|nr:hypothetical protein [Acidimicrobiaceae bacterium]MDQ1444110.1 hypothetical protein [Acidimicrobiaceae bacterium]
MKGLRRFVALAAVAALGVAATVPASADQVTVSITNPGGSRTLYVENLLGQPLTALDFGTSRSQPFRVRVVDATMDRSGFQVLTTMSHLYKVSGQSYDWASKIASSDLAISYPPNPLNLLNVRAVVAPIFDMTETLTGTLCTTVQAAGGSCTVAMSAIDGLRQTVDLVIDLADLNNLPLIPQIGEVGDFTSPDFAGIGANDPAKPNTFTPTNRRVISGAVSTATTTLTSVTNALKALVAQQAVGSLVDPDTLSGAVRDALGGPVFDALPASSVQTIMDGLTATVRNIASADIVGQSGTYLSYPKLDVTVPDNTSPGSYQGTLVVTAVQL